MIFFFKINRKETFLPLLKSYLLLHSLQFFFAENLKMALSIGVFSTFLPRETVSFGNSSSPLSLKLAPANLRSISITAAAKPAAEAKKREPRGIMKPRRVSPDMQAFLGGATEFPRTQVLKEIWAYIKQHNLQVRKP